MGQYLPLIVSGNMLHLKVLLLTSATTRGLRDPKALSFYEAVRLLHTFCTRAQRGSEKFRLRRCVPGRDSMGPFVRIHDTDIARRHLDRPRLRLRTKCVAVEAQEIA